VPVRGALPESRSRIIGRAPDIAAVARLVQQERLVTLTGSPGGGKTRLAFEVGRSLEPELSGGVRLVELALVGDPALVPNAVTDALGVQEEPERPAGDTLVDALAQAEPVLLLLDNCEHVLDGVAALVVRLLAACPRVRLLATSRAPLDLRDEHVHQVPPLTPAAGRELFVERAGRASTSFRRAVDDQDHAAIEALCAQLGGLPLLIELTAAWTRMLPVREIAAHLDDDMPQLLTSEARDVPERHADLARIVDSSLRRLDPADQELFARLSVFVGGFDLAAAEAIAGRRTGLLAGLATLVDNSLVLAESSGQAPARYRLLEPLRQHGARALAASREGETIRRRHAEHYLQLAQRCQPYRLDGTRPELPLTRLEPERGNLAAALGWARDQPPDLALRICLASAPLWEFHGPMNEGRAWLDKALAAGTSDVRLRVAALERAVKLAWRQGDYDRAQSLLVEGLAAAAELGDPWWLAIVQTTGALVATATGDLRRAEGLCAAGISWFERAGGEPGLIWALTTLGWVRCVEGRPEEGYALMQRALEANLVADNPTAAALAHLGMAYGACLSDQPARQRQHLAEALAATRADGNLELADWLGVGAGLAAREGRHRTALRLAGGSLAHGRHTESRMPEPMLRPLLGLIVEVIADVGPEQAAQLIEDGRQTPWDVLVADTFAPPGPAPRPDEAPAPVPARPEPPRRLPRWIGDVSVQVAASVVTAVALALAGALVTLVR
jgi:predicted ATPase